MTARRLLKARAFWRSAPHYRLRARPSFSALAFMSCMKLYLWAAGQTGGLQACFTTKRPLGNKFQKTNSISRRRILFHKAKSPSPFSFDRRAWDKPLLSFLRTAMSRLHFSGGVPWPGAMYSSEGTRLHHPSLPNRSLDQCCSWYAA